MGDSYGYNLKEIRRAQMAGNQLNTRKANTAKRAMEELQDKLAWYGDVNFNIQGFFNYPGITELTLVGGAWSTKTPDEIIIDLSALIDGVSVPTYGREEATQIILPRVQYNLIKNTRMTDGDSTTVLNFFKNNNPGVSIDIIDELVGVGEGGTDRAMAYVKDPEHLTMELPQPFEQLEANLKGMEYIIPCHAEYGGVIIYYPQSVAYVDGI
jgi:hypothetical protein